MTDDRNKRLASDYCEMLKIQDQPYLSWIVTKGELPYAEEYLLSVRIRSYVYSQKAKVCAVGVIHNCTVKVTLYPSYPHVAPDIRMLDIPPVFHPAWYSKGTYCAPKPWSEEESLKDYVLQMIGTLQYDPLLIDTDLPANYKALDWYQKNRDHSDLFPSDTTELTENPMDEALNEEEASAHFEEVVDSWTLG